MLLSNGTRLGPYEIAAPIGAGGMGQVYRARDTRLDRVVAIKVSSERFSERFEREARAIAALNHPRICQLYDVGPNYLVMEHIEGRPVKGPLGVDQAIAYGAQICDALDAAHRTGIIHRDLKPANILVTRAGVKLLDFGLAKMASAAAVPEATMTLGITGEGQIVGTLYYMSPEQLEGREADQRSDIFSFGVVLFEMLTGKRPFDGASRASVIASILQRDPLPISGNIPSAVNRVLRSCLEKDPEKRWQNARDLKTELEWIGAGDLKEGQAMPRRAFLPQLAGAAALGAAGAAGVAAWLWRGRESPGLAQSIRFRLAPTEGAWHKLVISRQGLAVSPVGGRVATIAGGDRGSMVWVQRLDSLTATPLAGTEDADVVFWSPDGQFIGFWSGGKLKKIPADGGTPLPICDLPGIWSATWNREGVIVAETARGVSSSISVQSGVVGPGRAMAWPRFLPDGKRLLYVKQDSGTGGHRAYVGELATPAETALMATDTYVTFAPDQTRNGVPSSEGHLLFGRGSTLLALRFDADRLRVKGEPIPVAREVPYFSARAWSEFDVSGDGILVCSSASQKSQLIWMDRSGREIGQVGDPQNYFQSFRLSPDGKRLAVDIVDFNAGGVDVWVYDLLQTTWEGVTFEPGSETWALWSPDGSRIAFASAQTGPPQIKVKAVGDKGSGGGIERSPFQIPTDWSSDGKRIFYETTGGDANGEIWQATVADGKVTPLLKGNSRSAHLSPNQEYLAFSATEIGRSEIYVQRLESDPPRLVGTRVRVSRQGGFGPRWRGDDRELFFSSPEPDRQLMTATINPGRSGGIEIGTPTALFHLPASALGAGNALYDVTPDGRKFLAPVRKAEAPPIQVMLNWQAGLRG